MLQNKRDFNIAFPLTPLVPLPQVSWHQQSVLLKAAGGGTWDNLSSKEWSSKGCQISQQLTADLLVRGCAGSRWAALASLDSWSPWWPFALSHHTFMWAHLVGTVLCLNTGLGYVPKGSTKAAQADLGDVPAQNQTLAWMLGKTTTALKKMKLVCRVAECLSSINPLCSSNVLFLPTAVVCLLTRILMRESSPRSFHFCSLIFPKHLATSLWPVCAAAKTSQVPFPQLFISPCSVSVSRQGHVHETWHGCKLCFKHSIQQKTSTGYPDLANHFKPVQIHQAGSLPT